MYLFHMHCCTLCPQVVLDVSGSNAVPPPDVDLDALNAPPPRNTTLIHLKDLVQALPSPSPTPLGYIDDDEEEEEKLFVSQRNASSTMDLLPTKPIVLYIWREHVKHNARVFKMIPAVSDLNEQCHITRGNDGGHFGLHEHRGISSLHFVDPVKHKAIYELQVTCEAIQKTKDDEAFTFTLELHIV